MGAEAATGLQGNEVALLDSCPTMMACANPLNRVWCCAMGSGPLGGWDCDFFYSSTLPRDKTHCSGSSRKAPCTSRPPTSLIRTPTTMTLGEGAPPRDEQFAIDLELVCEEEMRGQEALEVRPCGP